MKTLTHPFPRLQDSAFWSACSRRRGLLVMLCVLFLSGLALGSAFAARFSVFSGAELPTLFSGIPVKGSGFIGSFTTFLLNTLFFLSAVFLLGLTAFGTAAVPLLSLLRGIAVGISSSSYLFGNGLSGLWISALSYLPAASASSLLFLLFSLRALVFSDCLRQLGFSTREGNLDIRSYVKDYFGSLSFAVAASLLCGVLSALSPV